MEDQSYLRITLRSCTVFWLHDLAMSQNDLNRFKSNEQAADRVLGPIHDWIAENCRHATSIYADGIWFCDDKEAILFKLFWVGQVC